MNVISGLPRSGTTLICNILNQNKDFHASSTSGLCEILSTLSLKYSNMEEITSAMVNDSETTQDILKKSMIALTKELINDKFYFDKSRGWTTNYSLFEYLFNGKAIICVRDPRDVIASIEKQHQKTIMFNDATNTFDKTLTGRVQSQLSNTGIVGMSIRGVEDLINRNKEPFILRYEDFTKQPEFTMRELYKYLEIDYYAHDFDNVKNTSKDIDAITRHKFPHKGSGKVEYRNSDWDKYISKNIADNVINSFPLYCKTFGYNL